MITIGKFDAARRQLETAIDLWFHEGDAVSTHTLAYAAYELIHYISKIRNPSRGDLLLDSSPIKEERRVEFVKKLKSAANFFKHAKEDGEKVIAFDPQLTEGFILFSILGVETAGERLNTRERAFMWWIYLDQPDLLTPSGKEMLTKLAPVERLDELRRLRKGKFFDIFLQAANKWRLL